MNWEKLGQIFVANRQNEWMYSHASNAVIESFNGDIARIYFTCRDQKSKSYIAYIDIDFGNDFKVIKVSEFPVLSPGEAGLFDDSGVVMGCFQEIGNDKYLYYLGWNLKVNVPWLNSIGRAKFDKDKNRFIKESRAPALDRSEIDPFTISYPSIIKDGNIYRMWYGSNLRWGSTPAKMHHVIKYAESTDGLNWKRSGEIAINLIYENEYALSKPWVIKDNGLYRMWYSCRGKGNIETYRIGYAESSDGRNWIRKDSEVGIDVSENGWDSQMISYPCVFNWKGRRFMLYNGNHYGKNGFGIAEWEND